MAPPPPPPPPLPLLVPVALLLLLSHIPSSAPASASSYDPIRDLVAKARSSSNASSSASDPSMQEQEESSGGSSGEEHKQESSSEEEAEKRRQKQAEAEAAERQAAAESKEYAKEKGLVSPTNGTGSYKGMAREFINGHNELRARYGLPPLVWDRAVARQARRWSTAMRKDCQLLHSGTKLYGESVFRSHDDWNATATEAVRWWGKEEPMYDKATGKCNGGRRFKECGHFALMVSSKYQKLGCGRAECYKGGVFITCNYYRSPAADHHQSNNSAPAPSPSPNSDSPSSPSSKTD